MVKQTSENLDSVAAVAYGVLKLAIGGRDHETTYWLQTSRAETAGVERLTP